MSDERQDPADAKRLDREVQTAKQPAPKSDKD